MATWVYFATPAGADEADTLTFALQHNVIYRNARNLNGNLIANVGKLEAGNNILLAFRHPNGVKIVHICALIAAVKNPVEGTTVIDSDVGLLAVQLAEAGYSVATDNAPGVIRLKDLRRCHIELQGAYDGHNTIHRLDPADAESVTDCDESCEDGRLLQPEERPHGPQKAVGDEVDSGLELALPGRPALLMAPFSQQEAAAAQQVWADHLGIDVEVTNSVGMKLRLLPPGKFQMGVAEEDFQYEDEEPIHTVTITKPKLFGVHAVTQAHWLAVMQSSPWQGGEIRAGR